MSNYFKETLLKQETPDLAEHTVAVFGAGNTAVLYQKCFQREGIEPAYYIDNSPAKQNTVFQGKPVVSLETLISLRKTFAKPLFVFICSANIPFFAAIAKQLAAAGILHGSPDSFVFRKNADKLREVYDYLADNISRETYTALIQARIENTLPPEHLVSDRQYFCLPSFRLFDAREVFVDCGAYTGDSVEAYVYAKSGVFDTVFAFEPETVNFDALRCRCGRLKKEWALKDSAFVLENAGVGAESTAALETKLPPPPRIILLVHTRQDRGSARIFWNTGRRTSASLRLTIIFWKKEKAYRLSKQTSKVGSWIC